MHIKRLKPSLFSADLQVNFKPFQTANSTFILNKFMGTKQYRPKHLIIIAIKSFQMINK